MYLGLPKNWLIYCNTVDIFWLYKIKLRNEPKLFSMGMDVFPQMVLRTWTWTCCYRPSHASHWMFKPHPWWFILHWPAGGCGLLAWKDSNGPTAHMPALYLHRDQTEAKQLPGAIKHCASVQTWLMAHSSLSLSALLNPSDCEEFMTSCVTSEQYIKSSHSSFYYKPGVMSNWTPNICVRTEKAHVLQWVHD